MVQSSGDENVFSIPDEAPEEVREFMDRGHRRASIADGERMMMDPGQVLNNIENTMRRLHADINVEVSVDGDLANEKELMVMMGDLMMASPLITFLVNTGMEIMTTGGYPTDLVTKALPDHYDITALIPSLKVNQRQHDIATTIFNMRSSSTRDLTEDDIDDLIEPLDLAGKIEVFIILFWIWGTKIGAMKNVMGTDR
ncbi:hypothetical protein DMH01_15485 [Amycolatopsis sp. WAC 04182]|uniref:hypothetical protein n=1 Tax=Amycolatopsis sp. WAC 04182 TaxID=2203198 RepID=UPI000F776F15|nr:hypothetical protein [Amycolatopsis sp. WAC 04182]RSN60683.1 hypothetical protein DMH01_15485 [Amycolatopsis sp. WAC 04182]